MHITKYLSDKKTRPIQHLTLLVVSQFTRVPFGVANGIACFQRIMDIFISEEKLAGTFAFLDNVTICGTTQEEHGANLERFLEAARRTNIGYNEDECVFSTTKLHILGYDSGKWTNKT